jgi:hypothetical protein
MHFFVQVVQMADTGKTARKFANVRTAAFVISNPEHVAVLLAGLAPRVSTHAQLAFTGSAARKRAAV